ncbi:MAG TPA: ATPase, T2SS/T4P/T4SS family [Steroidobacteraceae bacterium]|jgi:twitching motility protein PilT|nr:ATPase, T2SS/T4P/T4SS family [Steroidobacteraceae bacterium]
MIVDEWIEHAWSLGASDLHLEAGTPLVARIRGDLQTVGGLIPGDLLAQAAHHLLGVAGWTQFTQHGSADISMAIGGVRCRVNFFQTVRGIAAAIRLLTPSIKDLQGCNLHPDFRKLVDAKTGLVIISGPTGSGKSTTLAALIEEINASRSRNIITLESPLEYLYTNRRSFIRQREIPTHSPSFEQGIIDALRENPDVLVVSEMRTPEVMRLTLNAAETGHLVLATMHSATCAEALSRLCMSFPSDIQASIRAQLADCLVGLSCQRLDFLSAHRLLVPHCEILLPSSGAKGTIRAGNFSQIANVLQSGGDEGMWTFDRYERWMEQVTDWVRPPQATTPGTSAEARLAQSATSFRPGVKAASLAARMPPQPAAPKSAQSRPAPASPAPADDVFEVPSEEMDLAELAELAKKVVERKP